MLNEIDCLTFRSIKKKMIKERERNLNENINTRRVINESMFKEPSSFTRERERKLIIL